MTIIRRWHRWFGTVAGVFLLILALTGTLLQTEKTIGFLGRSAKPPAPVAEPSPIDPVAQAQRAQALAARSHPGVAVTSMTLDAKGGKPTAVVRFAGQPSPVVYDLVSGVNKVQNSAPKPPSLGQRISRLAFDIHVITFAGAFGHALGAIFGFSLLFLSGSGLWMWIRLGRERGKRNLGSWLWR